MTATSLADAKKQGAVLAWGSFVTIAINFLIVAFALFLVVKGINRLKTKDEQSPPTAAPTAGSAAERNPRPAGEEIAWHEIPTRFLCAARHDRICAESRIECL